VPSTTGLHVAALARKASVAQVEQIVRRAAAAGVACHTLASRAVTDRPRAGLVLGYGAIPTARIEEGLRLLHACFATG
jgi:GntR family transcriptional regulator/MocR family aminotransferase